MSPSRHMTPSAMRDIHIFFGSIPCHSFVGSLIFMRIYINNSPDKNRQTKADVEI